MESLWAITTVVRPRDTLSRGVLYLAFREGVEGRGRFVEDQDRRSLEDRARDGDALLLAPRELQAALADLGAVAFRNHGHEAVDLGKARSLSHVGLARGPASIADVVAERVVEQHRILRHHADGVAQGGLGDTGDILAVDRDAPAVRLVEAEQQA